MANEKTVLPYREIKNLLEGEKRPWEYSFELEAEGIEGKESEIEEYRKKEAIERYFIYKSTDKKLMSSCYDKCKEIVRKNIDKYGAIPDCDGSGGDCKIAIDLYEKLWDRKEGACKEKTFLRLNNQLFGTTLFGGDTMNSMQTTLDELLKSITKENAKYNKEKKGNFSIRYCLQIYDLYDDFIANLESNEELKKFASAYHTLGNFVLVPAYFNKERGGFTPPFDFWDSSLAWLKNSGFIAMKTKIQSEKNPIIHTCYRDYKAKGVIKIRDVICADEYNNNQKASEFFEFDRNDFIKYINYFFLWDYVKCFEHKNGTKEYIINPLFPSHEKIEKSTITDAAYWTDLQSEDDAIKFMEKATNFITRRGIFMTAMLRLQAEIDEAKYSELRKAVFAVNDCYENYDGVFKKITGILEEMQSRLNNYDSIIQMLNEHKDKINNPKTTE